MTQQIATINNIKIWHETFGNKSNPCVLLVMGAGAQAILWPTKFCQELAESGYFVIRYDNRDVGLSSCMDFNKHPYDLSVLARDAVDLLNSLNIKRAHVIGASMGGYIGQLIAINYPDKILTLTCLSSTTDLSVLSDVIMKKSLNAGKKLPLPKPPVMKLLTSQESVDTSKKNDYVKQLIDSWMILHGVKGNCDLPFFKTLAEQCFDRDQKNNTTFNHLRAIERTIFNTKDKLFSVSIPILVIHGKEDPILPFPHGESIAKAAKNAKFVLIENMGHVLMPIFFAPIIEEIKQHIKM